MNKPVLTRSLVPRPRSTDGAGTTRPGGSAIVSALAIWGAVVGCAPAVGGADPSATGGRPATGGASSGTGGAVVGSGGMPASGGQPGGGGGRGGGTTTGTGGTPASGGAGAAGAGGRVGLAGASGSGGAAGGRANTGGAPASGGAGGRAGTGGQGGAGNPGSVVAFPGAEGYGRNSLGGRGGAVCHVTTLADAGAGSLRDCLSQGNRTVVFDVGGWITLASAIGITASNITIAGQTAPGGGIGVRGQKISIGGKHIVMRFVRVRRGIMVTEDRNDAMAIASSSDNVIVDHCSVSFGTDETLSMPGDEGIGPHNLTLQWSIVAFGLQRNNHSAGALFTSNQTTIHHSLWAFNKTRNPRARSEEASNRGLGGPLDWVNNVIYGWNAPDPVGESMGWSISYDPFILAGTENGTHQANAVGNYFISRRAASYAFHKGTPNFSLFAADNILDGNANGVLDMTKSGTDMIEGTPTLLGQRIAAPLVATDAPRVAFDRVMASVGATVPIRDQVDALLVSQVKAQTGNLIQSEQDLVALGVGDGGYGTLAAGARAAGFDSDQDGMPNAWETASGLNPSDAADRSGDTDGDGYTNLEEYLNSLVP